MKITTSLLFFILLSIPGAASTAFAGDGSIQCELHYSLSGWSFFYKEADGTGELRCSDGETAKVRLQARGGGFSFGRSETVDGKGKFNAVQSISDLYGVYVSAEAHAGASDSAIAKVMKKGSVSLSLVGTGKGVNLGIAFGSFKIEPL